MRRGLHRAAPSHRRHRQVRRQRRQRLLAVTGVVALAVVAVVVAGGYGYAHWRFGQITSIDLPGLTKAPPPGKPQVVLVVGSDSRSQLTRPGDAQKFGTTQDAGGVRSDVIMLVRLDPAAHTAKILSIPRDLLVPIAGTSGRGKINAAFASGPAQLIQTIQTQLGTPINHYLLINFDGFRTIINALGGIRMNFPYPAADAYSGLRITHPGCQQLSGEQALSVARARHYRYFKDGRWQADPLSTLAASSASRPSCAWWPRPGSPEGSPTRCAPTSSSAPSPTISPRTAPCRWPTPSGWPASSTASTPTNSPTRPCRWWSPTTTRASATSCCSNNPTLSGQSPASWANPRPPPHPHSPPSHQVG